jgi:high affinity sulfate transporter 1
VKSVGERAGSGWTRWIPGIELLRTYERPWLRDDIVAGLVLTALLVPQGMAYAEVSGLPAVTGLYTTVLALVGYAIFGPSRTLVLGPDSSLAPLIAAVVLPLAVGDDPTEAVMFAGALAVLTGALIVAAGLARAGRITELLSKPVRIGYLNGIALIVLVSQLPKLFGFSVDADGFLDELVAFFDGVLDGSTYLPALLIGLASLAVMIVGNRIFPRFPAVLVAVVGSTMVASLLGMAEEGLSVVGPLPKGFPTPAVPMVSLDELMSLFGGAVAIALLAFADTSALSRTFAARKLQVVDPNHEAIALGIANISAGFFHGFPVSGSSSRTVVAETLRAKTQLTGIVGAGAILFMLVFANSLLADLPSATLAAVVIVASFGLFDLATIRWLARVRRSDFALSIAALAAVVLIGVLGGLLLAIGMSLAVFVWRTWRPYTAVLGRVPGRKGYHDLSRHPEAEQIPGLVLFRFDAPLFFANAANFEETLFSAIERAGDVRRVVVAAEPMTDVDSTGAEALSQVLDRLEARGIELAFAELKGPVKDRLVDYGLYDRIGTHDFFPTVGTAVSDYLGDEPSVEWEDWTDR